MKKRYFLILYSLLNICSIYSMNQQCSLEQLPPEIHGKIIENVFNLKCDLKLQKKLSTEIGIIDQRDLNNDMRKKLLTAHLLLGCKFVDEFCEIEKLCEKRIFNTCYFNKYLGLTREIFCLSKEESGALAVAARDGFMECSVIDEETFNIIANIRNKNITKGLSFEVMSTNDKILRICVKAKNIGTSCGAIGFCMFYGFILLSLKELNPSTWFLARPSVFLYITLVGAAAQMIGVSLVVISSTTLSLYNQFFCKEDVSVQKRRL